MADCAEMEAWIRELVEEIVVSALPFEEEEEAPPSDLHHKRRLCFEDEGSTNKRFCPSQDQEWNITFLPDEIGLTQPDSSAARVTSEDDEETIAALRKQVRQLTEERDLWKKSHADAVKALEEASSEEEARADSSSTNGQFNQDDGCAMAELLW